MKMRLNFELRPAIVGAMKSSNYGIDDTSNDGDNVCIFSEIPDCKDFVTITLDKHIFDVVSRLSNESIKKTRRSLKEAVKNAVKNNEWHGCFTLYLDSGAFDIAN